MNPKPTDIFGRLDWLTKKIKNLLGRVYNLEQSGGGTTNPTSTYIPYNNAGTFADSYLTNDTANSILKSVYGGNDVGIKCDFVNGDVYLGDPFGIIGPSSTSVYMYVTPGSEQVSLNAGGNTYFYCEKATDSCYVGTYSSNFYFTEGSSVRLFDNGLGGIYNGFEINYSGNLSSLDNVKLGDYSNLITGASFEVDVLNSLIKTQYGGNDIGLKLDFANGYYILGYPTVSGGGFYLNTDRHYVVGDFNGIDNGTIFKVEDNNEVIKTRNRDNDIGLKLDFANGIYSLGDYNYIQIDNSNNQININNTTNNVKIGEIGTANKTGNVLYNYVERNIDLTLGNYQAEIGGVYVVSDADVSNTFRFPDPTLCTGQMLVLINNDLNIINNTIQIGGTLPLDRGTGNTINAVPQDTMLMFFSDGIDWRGGQVKT